MSSSKLRSVLQSLFRRQVISLTLLESVEENFINLHIKKKHDKMYNVSQALISYAKAKVTIMGQTFCIQLETAEANTSKLYRKVKQNEKGNQLKL